MVVLAAVAVPTYEQYQIRAKAMELILAQAPYRTAMMEWVASRPHSKSWPASPAELHWPQTPAGRYLQQIRYRRAATARIAAIEVLGEIEGQQVRFFSEADLSGGEVRWRCTSNIEMHNLLPRDCAHAVSAGL